MKKIIILLITSLVIFSCKKESDHDKDLRAISGKWEQERFSRTIMLEIFPKYGGNKDGDKDGNVDLYVDGELVGEGSFGFQWNSKNDFTIVLFNPGYRDDYSGGTILYSQLIYDLVIINENSISIKQNMNPVDWSGEEITKIIPDGEYKRVR